MKASLLPYLGLLSLSASHAETSLTLSSGIDYSTGKYGQSERTETLYVPIVIKYEFSDWTFRAVLPYVESTGPSTVSGSGADRVTLNTGQKVTKRVAGLGDIVLSGSWVALEQGPWLIELGGKIKVATADESAGLGTGKNDYSIQSEIYRVLGSHTLFGTLGYKKMGDPEGTDLKDPFFASVGWSLRASQNTALGLSFDFRQKIQDGGAPIREATGFVTHKLDKNWKLQTYLVSGFTKATPDLGGGLIVFYTY